MQASRGLWLGIDTIFFDISSHTSILTALLTEANSKCNVVLAVASIQRHTLGAGFHRPAHI